MAAAGERDQVVGGQVAGAATLRAPRLRGDRRLRSLLVSALTSRPAPFDMIPPWLTTKSPRNQRLARRLEPAPMNKIGQRGPPGRRYARAPRRREGVMTEDDLREIEERWSSKDPLGDWEAAEPEASTDEFVLIARADVLALVDEVRRLQAERPDA
jgi:hypothetical protein